MKQKALPFICAVIGMLLICANGFTASLDSAADFVGELLKNHPYLLSDNERESLDEINRTLRETRQELREEITERERRQLLEQADDAIEEMGEAVTEFDFIIPVQIDNDSAYIDRDEPVKFPGDIGAMLFHIEGEDGDISYNTIQIDYSEFPGSIQLEKNVDNGDSYTLVSLTNAPAEMVTLPIRIVREDDSNLSAYIQIQTPKFARLNIKVVSDKTGEPVPSMMQLVWKTNGVDRPASNAIEFAPQMDSQGSPSGRRRARLPGDLGGPFWCVPGPFTMQVPPGEWQLAVRRGVETLAIKDSFTLTEGETIFKTYRLRRWVNMREHGWYSGDDHVHCQILSDGDAERLMAWVQAEDIHLANVVKMGDVYRTWFEQRGWGNDYRVIDGDYVLSPGQECPRTHQELGHTIHMNTDSMVRDTEKYFLYDWIFGEVHKQGGLSGFCHVLVNMFEVHRGMTLLAPDTEIDFIEIMQFNQLGTGLFYDFLNLGFKMTAGAGSDVPWGGTVGEVRMYAYLGDTPFSPDSWFEAVRRGRTFVTNGPMIEFQVNGAHPGDEIQVNEGESIHISARVWGHPERFAPSQLEIVSQGEVIKSVESDDANKTELNLEFDAPADNGFWIAARAKGSDGSQAHTTPVYVVRPPYRFWKLDDVEELLDKRYQSLREVGELIEDYTSQMEENPHHGDYKIAAFNRQAPELKKRVDQARKHYEELEKLAEKEREMLGR